MFFQYFSAKEYEQGYLDIICFFNCFHDFGDLLRAIEQAQTNLSRADFIRSCFQ